ncbi:CACTA en-spm transposon protein [Cucumis melo var. makuwa]|uniref:CACTA en-spm transposon protein n=1 Tax=Cucumis melo var. makuwa TaxID=1194695 RepID=A0A5D3DTK2_CUCMM|nr:CACTA en-spm transposon protein [Cucumis melo var. makuwa]
MRRWDPLFKTWIHSLSEQPIYYPRSGKWSIPDAEKDVDIKNVGNKVFPNAINTASEEASGKHCFPTHHEGVGKYSSGKGIETERGKERRSRESRRFCRPSAVVLLSSVTAVHRHCPSPPSATLDNIAGGSSSVGDNTGSSSQQTTPTPRRRAQSRFLELEHHVAINGRIPMTIEITKH